MPKKIFAAHPTVIIEKGARIGRGTAIWCFSHIMKGAQIGQNCKLGQNVVVHPTAVIRNHVKIQNNVSVYDMVELEDYVFCGPSCVFTNIINPRSAISRNSAKFYRKTRVCYAATIGANATIVCGHTIGRFAFVGAGAVVTKDVADYALVYGNPARQNGWICECGERLLFKTKTSICKCCHLEFVKTATGISRKK